MCKKHEYISEHGKSEDKSDSDDLSESLSKGVDQVTIINQDETQDEQNRSFEDNKLLFTDTFCKAEIQQLYNNIQPIGKNFY